MSIQDLEKAFYLINKNYTDEECIFSLCKDEMIIKLAEEELHVLFPETYKEFIKKVGFGGPGGLLISGIRSDDTEEVKKTGVVWLNIRNRISCNQPLHLIQIETVGEGTTYCLDTSQMNDQNECPVVAWPIDGYDATPTLEIIAPDFGKFFLDMVEKEIAYKKDTV